MIKAVLHSLEISAANGNPTNARAKELGKQAEHALSMILQRPLFSKTILKWKFTHTRRKSGPGKYINETRKRIRLLVLGGIEYKQPRDYEIDLRVSLYDFPSGTLGSAPIGGKTIRTDVDFFRKCAARRPKADGAVSLAAHWMHEWSHNAGFVHGSKKDGTVPYELGDIVKYVANNDESFRVEFKNSFGEEATGELGTLYTMTGRCEEEDTD